MRSASEEVDAPRAGVRRCVSAWVVFGFRRRKEIARSSVCEDRRARRRRRKRCSVRWRKSRVERDRERRKEGDLWSGVLGALRCKC